MFIYIWLISLTVFLVILNCKLDSVSETLCYRKTYKDTAVQTVHAGGIFYWRHYALDLEAEAEPMDYEAEPSIVGSTDSEMPSLESIEGSDNWDLDVDSLR